MTQQTSRVGRAAERDVQQDQAVAVTFNGTINPKWLLCHNWLSTKEGGYLRVGGLMSLGNREGGYLRVGGSMGPGDRAAAKSTAPMVSAMPAAAAPVMEMTSPALALSSSSLPTPLRLKILVTLLSPPGAPATTTNG